MGGLHFLAFRRGQVQPPSPDPLPTVPAASPLVTKVKELRLQREDFEILKVIGRGAFGEVSSLRGVSVRAVVGGRLDRTDPWLCGSRLLW